jgi:membrane-associated phospholipid phosphatase
MMMATYYICYTFFRFFPVAGPRYIFPLQETPAIHTPIAAFAHKLVAGGSSWGTAFPSSHVAVAFVNAANSWRSSHKFGGSVWILALLLAFATVYGQFHYAIDAVAGAAMAFLVLGTAHWTNALKGRFTL